MATCPDEVPKILLIRSATSHATRMMAPNPSSRRVRLPDRAASGPLSGALVNLVFHRHIGRARASLALVVAAQQGGTRSQDEHAGCSAPILTNSARPTHRDTQGRKATTSVGTCSCSAAAQQVLAARVISSDSARERVGAADPIATSGPRERRRLKPGRDVQLDPPDRGRCCRRRGARWGPRTARH